MASDSAATALARRPARSAGPAATRAVILDAAELASRRTALPARPSEKLRRMRGSTHRSSCSISARKTNFSHASWIWARTRCRVSPVPSRGRTNRSAARHSRVPRGLDGDPQVSEPLRALLRAAIGNAQATVHLRELIQERVIDDLSPRLRESGDMTTRIEIACSLLVGIIVGRQLMRLKLAHPVKSRQVRRLHCPKHPGNPGRPSLGLCRSGQSVPGARSDLSPTGEFARSARVQWATSGASAAPSAATTPGTCPLSGALMITPSTRAPRISCRILAARSPRGCR